MALAIKIPFVISGAVGGEAVQCQAQFVAVSPFSVLLLRISGLSCRSRSTVEARDRAGTGLSVELLWMNPFLLFERHHPSRNTGAFTKGDMEGLGSVQ